MSRGVTFYAIPITTTLTTQKKIVKLLEQGCELDMVFDRPCFVFIDAEDGEASPLLNLEEEDREYVYWWIDNNKLSIYKYSWSYH